MTDSRLYIKDVLDRGFWSAGSSSTTEMTGVEATTEAFDEVDLGAGLVEDGSGGGLGQWESLGVGAGGLVAAAGVCGLLR